MVLPGADLDQLLGLILLRESQPLRVYATPSVRKIIMEKNIVFAMVKKQVTWMELIPGEEFEQQPKPIAFALWIALGRSRPFRACSDWAQRRRLLALPHGVCNMPPRLRCSRPVFPK